MFLFISNGKYLWISVNKRVDDDKSQRHFGVGVTLRECSAGGATVDHRLFSDSQLTLLADTGHGIHLLLLLLLLLPEVGGRLGADTHLSLPRCLPCFHEASLLANLVWVLPTSHLLFKLWLLWNIFSAWHRRHPHMLGHALVTANKRNPILLVLDASKNLPHPVKQGEAPATSTRTLWLPCSSDWQKPFLRGRMSHVSGAFSGKPVLCAAA